MDYITLFAKKQEFFALFYANISDFKRFFAEKRGKASEQRLHGLAVGYESEQSVHEHEHTRIMERAFPHGALLGVADRVVAVQIAVPFAEFMIGEMNRLSMKQTITTNRNDNSATDFDVR